MNKRPLAAVAVTLAVATALVQFGGPDVPDRNAVDPNEQVEPGAADSIDGDEDGAAPAESEGAASDETKEEPDMASDSPNFPEPVALAVESFASSLQMEADEVSVVKVEPVTWSDGSLGCPQPGMMYTQMLTEGYRVTLNAGDEQAVFHTDRRSQVVRCENPSPSGLYESESAPTH